MGRKTPGIAPEPNGTWSVDKVWRGRRLRRRGFVNHEEAQGWLIAQLQALRLQKYHPNGRFVVFEATHATSAIKRPTHVTLGGTPLFERTEAILLELSSHEEVPF